MAQPTATEHPASLAELVAIVKATAATGRRMKVLGAGHARNGMASTDGIQIVLDRYRRMVDVDRDRGLVTVQAGIREGEFSQGLAGWGLQLDDIPGLPGQTIGGLMATGQGSLAARVTGLQLVCADGSVISCSAREEPDIFDAARVSLGALGVISTATLQCAAGFNLRSVTEISRFDSVLERFDELVDGNDHLTLSWMPRTGMTLVNRRNRTDEPPRRHTRGRVDRGYRVPPLRLARPAVEYSIPRTEAVATLRQVRELSGRSGNGLLFPVRVSVAAADDIWLSPATGRPSVVVGTDLDGFEALMDSVGGRPHWGAMHHQTAATLRPRYPRWDAWQAVRRRLDPDRRLANDYTDRCVG